MEALQVRAHPGFSPNVIDVESKPEQKPSVRKVRFSKRRCGAHFKVWRGHASNLRAAHGATQASPYLVSQIQQRSPKEGALTIRGFLCSLRKCFLQGQQPIDHVELFELITAK